MRNLYTIIKGSIDSKKEICEIPFALIFHEDGVYYIETFFNDPTFFERNKNSDDYSLIGETEKGYDIECFGLFISNYHSNNQKVTFICEKFIRLTNNKKENRTKNEKDPVYFIEIEGMKMHFGDHTEIKKYRNSGEVDDILNYDFDHTTSTFIINHPDFVGNCFNILLFKNPENENILIDFDNQKGNYKLYYENYLKFKEELISFLSFINGAQIFVRKEFTGNYLSIKGQYTKYDAQVIYLYSFTKRNERHYNSYLPITKNHSDTHKIFSELFLFGFDKYFQLNKYLDFNSLIYSLNSTNSTGLDESYYVLITALERISRNYARSLVQNADYLISKDVFENKIKPRLYEVLSDFKNEIVSENRSAWNIYSSKIGNLNKKNIIETTQKLYEFLNFAKIKINAQVNNLVENERDTAVHEGIIGSSDKEKIQNYLKLDHILRDVVLNLIEYKGKRNRKFDYELERDDEK